MQNTKISIQNIVKSFGNNITLDNISFDIYEKEILYIIGKSGTGKSVLLKILSLLMEPNSGKVIVNNENILEFSEIRSLEFQKKIGVLFQYAALFDSLSIFDNVAFSLRRFTDFSEKVVREKVLHYLELVGLSNIENDMVSSLSGGMQKRVGLARTLMLEPEVIFYDEPTTGVDPISRASIDDLIRTLNDQLGVTSIIVSHDVVSTFSIADRVGMLDKGKLIKLGTPQEYQECTDDFICQFIEGRESIIRSTI